MIMLMMLLMCCQFISYQAWFMLFYRNQSCTWPTCYWLKPAFLTQPCWGSVSISFIVRETLIKRHQLRRERYCDTVILRYCDTAILRYYTDTDTDTEVAIILFVTSGFFFPIAAVHPSPLEMSTFNPSFTWWLVTLSLGMPSQHFTDVVKMIRCTVMYSRAVGTL